MPRFSRPLIAGVAALSLLGGISPASAEDASPDPASVLDAATSGLPEDLTLPVPAADVTDTDESLRSTRNEVSVVVATGRGRPP